MFRRTLIIVFWGISGLWAVQGQSIEGLNQQIDSLTQQLKQLENRQAQIEDELDKLKLQRIHEKIVKYGLPAHPDTAEIVHHMGYSLSYNDQHEQANWVVHIVTDDVQDYESSRTNDYRIDTAVQSGTAEKGDYWYSGYDRGHLAASADFRWDKEALSNTYYYSNMVPMRPALNRQCWAELENFTREWAVEFGEVFVVSGGVLHEDLKSTGQHTRNLSVPNRYYKVIVDYTEPGYKGIGFLLPNDTCHKDIYDYTVTIDSIERLTGIDFFPKIPDPQENAIERSFDLDNWKIQHTVTDAPPLTSLKPGRLNTSQAQKHIGQRVTVCGTVVATKYSSDSKGKPTFLNLDRPFPNSPFSVTIWGHSRKNFSYAPEKYLIGKEVCITDKIDEYQGTPQMVLDNQKQVEVLHDGDEKGGKKKRAEN